ncbi:MAG: 3-hydroxyacyl-CoA dehydrogenase NAD-binding domain-containing protein [Alphaproteobacteria bacterium]|nr:3-hydroxyacyl-CoA dehydrogenase NAD-binding domain-containing protein [Alphaproteobacteria bacterium]
MSDLVRVSVQDRIAVIRVANPPVNALSQGVRQGLSDAIETVDTSADIDAAIIVGDGRTFIAGADISEFGKPPLPPALPDVVNRIEASMKPVVAVLHGTALGGGLEVALGAHYRVGLKGARVGLPEVTLGILPGAGGTQRMPRLVGAEAALDMITSGRHVPITEAEKLGIVDAVSDEADPEAAGLAFALKLLAEGKGVRRIRDMDVPAKDEALLSDWRGKVTKSARGQIAPPTCVDAVEAALTLPFDEGLAEERRLFKTLLESPQREGLIHAFFSERKVAKLPELKGVEPRQVASIGVIGGGTMGAGIAFCALLNGLDVTLIERDQDAADKAAGTIAKLADGSVKRGKLTQDRRDALVGKSFRAVTDYAALSDADLVVEAVFESMDVKKDVFTKLDAVCKPGAVLATNTSYLDINEIAAMTARPQDVIGLHFFSPAHIMKLLEVVVADRTAPNVVATGFALAKTLKKIAVRAGVCDGFIGNRMLAVYRAAADHMILDGASPYQIDKALVSFGFAMGPFAVSDLAGLDIGWATRKRRAATRDPRERVPTYADRICENGWFGQKTGRGYYKYEDGARKGTPDPEVEQIIAEERAKLGIQPREFSDEEIVRRYMAAMINEAAKIVDEGIARRPLDVDITLLSGYGFPRWRGGPMKYADMVGLDRILDDIRTFAQEDDYFWQPARLIEDLVAKGANFDSLNNEG